MIMPDEPRGYIDVVMMLYVVNIYKYICICVAMPLFDYAVCALGS